MIQTSGTEKSFQLLVMNTIHNTFRGEDSPYEVKRDILKPKSKPWRDAIEASPISTVVPPMEVHDTLCNAHFTVGLPQCKLSVIEEGENLRLRIFIKVAYLYGKHVLLSTIELLDGIEPSCKIYVDNYEPVTPERLGDLQRIYEELDELFIISHAKDDQIALLKEICSLNFYVTDANKLAYIRRGSDVVTEENTDE
ncbi:MAG: hypothetical protein MJZ34_02250 [Paludibacteraceae bacterium]|nr:hypothetical protein [Paludibacteraceae bacterium]